MTVDIIPKGHVTTPKGFLAGAVCASMYAAGPKAGALDHDSREPTGDRTDNQRDNDSDEIHVFPPFS